MEAILTCIMHDEGRWNITIWHASDEIAFSHANASMRPAWYKFVAKFGTYLNRGLISSLMTLEKPWSRAELAEYTLDVIHRAFDKSPAFKCLQEHSVRADE